MNEIESLCRYYFHSCALFFFRDVEVMVESGRSLVGMTGMEPRRSVRSLAKRRSGRHAGLMRRRDGIYMQG